MNGEMDKRWTVDRWIERMDGKDGWMDGWMNGWIKELMEIWRDGWIERKYGMD